MYGRRTLRVRKHNAADVLIYPYQRSRLNSQTGRGMCFCWKSTVLTATIRQHMATIFGNQKHFRAGFFALPPHPLSGVFFVSCRVQKASRLRQTCIETKNKIKIRGPTAARRTRTRPQLSAHPVDRRHDGDQVHHDRHSDQEAELFSLSQVISLIRIPSAVGGEAASNRHPST